jgi:hypothetical protein
MNNKRKIIAWILFAIGIILALYPFGFVEKLIGRYPSVDSELIAKFYMRGYVDKWYLSAVAVILFFLALMIKKDEN